MARTKHVISRQTAEEIPIEDSSSSSSGEEMETPPAMKHSEESTAEETAEEEASPRHGKALEGRVSIQKLINFVN